MALDTSGTPTLTKIPKGGTPGCITGSETNASTPEAIIAAPGAGLHIFLTEIVLSSDDADAHPIIQDEDDNLLFGVLMSAVEGGTMRKPSNGMAIRVTANKAVELSATAGNVGFYVEYVVARTTQQ